jgi:type IV pilus biogenesis protein CpaD/CtpE
MLLLERTQHNLDAIRRVRKCIVVARSDHANSRIAISYVGIHAMQETCPESDTHSSRERQDPLHVNTPTILS